MSYFKVNNIEKNLMAIILILLIIFLLIPFGFSGNNIEFEVIDRDSGLTNLSVSTIIEDKYGFLWFGTQGGLSSYDGKTMTTYKKEPFESNDLVHNLIQTMYYDEEKHELWIGTYHGISHFIINEKRFINYTMDDSNLSNSIVIAIEKDHEGNLWFGTMEGLNKLDVSEGEITNYAIEGNVVRDLYLDIKNRLWIGTYDGLHYFEDNEIKKEGIDLPSKYVMVIQPYKENQLTLGLWDGGLVNYDIEKKEITEKYTFSDNRVYTMTPTINGCYFVGTWGGGLYCLKSNGSIVPINEDNGYSKLPSNVIYSLYEDTSGILWIGTNGGGIAKLNPRNRSYVQFSSAFQDSRQLTPGKINAILEDSNEDLWVAIYNDGLNRYVRSEDEMLRYQVTDDEETKLTNESIMDIFETSKKDLLIAHGEGLSKYNKEKDTFEPMDILPEETITYAIAEDQKNNLWIGTYYNGLYYYNFSTEELINYKKESVNNISDNLVYDIIVDSKDRVWVATNDGLNLLKPGEESFQMFYSDDTNQTTLASQVVRVIFEDSKGRIWIGMTSGGVARYNEDTGDFINYTENDGLSSNIVLGIQECVHGNIWVSTHSGISIIDTENNIIEVLTPNDGIGGWEFNTGSAKDKENNLYFGGVHGITIIPTDFVDLETPIPKVYIKDVQVFGESLDVKKTIFNDSYFTFDYSDQYIGFDLSTIFYDAPEQVKYFYKLDGFDENWVAIGSRNYISFSNLLPGDYVLNVRAKTLKTDFSEIEQVSFTVNKPWYLEYWAFIIYLAGLIMMFYFGSKVRQWYMLKHENIDLNQTNKKLVASNKDLEEIATRDPLTGLYNRRYFNELMKDLVNIAKRESSNLIFVMLDIDHFKAINDTFGHLAGDDYLIDVANILQDELRRSTDFAVRYAGDEFALVLFDTTEEKALEIANAIKDRIKGIKIRKEYTNDDYSTTVSMGMVFLDNQVEATPKEIFKVADNALYKVKNRGRDNIEVIRNLNEGDFDD